MDEPDPGAVLGPETCQYRGGNGRFSRVRNTGRLVLTPTALIVKPLIGKEIAVERTDITGTRVQRTFNGNWNGRRVLVVETADGEFGLSLRDLERWRSTLDTLDRGA